MNTETHRQLANDIYFYCYEPPRELALIEGENRVLVADIVRLLGEVTA